MERTPVQKLAAALRVLVLIVLGCNIVALFAVPGMTLLIGSVDSVDFMALLMLLPRAWMPAYWIWMDATLYHLVLGLFLLACGVCTALILWQAKRVLDSILRADTFSFDNAANMRRAAVCCFVITVAALIRVIIRVAMGEGFGAILSYNALFVPVFLIAGLVCMVMSALFRQAAELKAENDLTI